MKLFSFFKHVFFLAVIFFSFNSKAQITVDTDIPYNSPIFLIDSLLLGSGVEASNHEFDGDPIQIGFFNGLASNIGLDSGIVMSTGDVRLLQPGFGGFGQAPNSNADDPDLLTVANSVPALIGQNFTVNSVNDVVILEFDFIPTSSELSFRYVFGSQEYFAYENTQFNDVFGFFISGPGIVGPYASPAGFPDGSINIATIPDSDPELPITISSVNAQLNSNFFVNNQGLETVSDADGFTTVITAEAQVTCGQTYHIRLSLADGSDTGLSSYVFLDAGSFSSPELQVSNSLNVDSNYIFTDCGVDVDLTAEIGGDYEFVWNTGSTDQTITVGPGAYWVEAVDSTDCAVNSDTIVVYSQPIPEIDFSTENELCEGSTLTIQSNVSDGTLPYNFFWQPGGDDEDLIVSQGGQYILTVVDSNGCSDTDTIDIIEYPIPDISYSPTEIVICGNVPVEVSAFGAETYSWSPAIGIDDPNAQTVFMSSSASLTYTLTGIDTNGCVNSTLVPTVSDEGFTISVDVDPVTCNGYDDGSITIIASDGAVTPVTYSIDGGDNFNDFFVFEDLTFGTYDILVRDNLGCLISQQVNVNGSEPDIEVIIGHQDVLCAEDTTGTVFIESISGGNISSDYNYNWFSSNNGDLISTDTVVSVPEGAYYLVVTDDNNCMATDQVMVEDPADLQYEIITSDVSCFGATDGAINVNIIAGGVGPFQFNWLNYGNANTNSLFNLGAGTYQLEITDDVGCVSVESITINSPALPFSISSSSSTVSCYNSPTGSVEVEVSGGTYPYFYNWSSGHITALADELTSGEYILQVTDASGCQLVDTFTVAQNPEIITDLSSTDVSCFGLSDGTASILASGGVGNLSFLWSTQSQQDELFGLSFGNYYVVTEDELGCKVFDTLRIDQPDNIRILLDVNDVLCNGDSTGSIESMVTGGTPFQNGSYTYSWFIENNQIGFNSPNLFNISSSQYPYQLVIEDYQGCSATSFAFVGEPELLKLDTSELVPAYCQNVATAHVSVIAEGGFLNTGSDYQFSWNNGVESSVLVNQNAGNYIAYVEDDNGCIDSLQIEIPLVPTFESSMDSTDLNCFEDNSGIATINVEGGFGPYNYNWNWSSGNEQITSNSNSFSKTSLPAGIVSVVVTDVNGCYLANQTQIVEPSELTYSVIKDNDESCSGDQSSCDGQITFNVSGGTAPYDYQWMDLDNNLVGSYVGTVTNLQASDLCNGYYHFEVTDDKGCIAQNNGSGLLAPVEIISGYEVTSDINLNTFTNNIVCFGDTAAFVEVLNPNNQFSYSWFVNGEFFDNGLNTTISAGDVTLLTSYQSCSTNSQSLVVNQPTPSLINSTINDISCYGSSDGSISIEAINPQGLTFSWSDNTTDQIINNLTAGTYELVITNVFDCTTSYSFEINEPQEIQIDATVTNVTCNGGDDGTISISISGGLSPYEVDWQGNDPLNMEAGSYQIVINDANFCSNTFTLDVDEPSSVSASFSANNTPFIANANGGTPPYNYEWLYFGFSVGQGSNYTPNQDGEYTLIVIDNNGCVGTFVRNYEGESVGISEFENIEFSVYPNPMNEFVTIEKLNDINEIVEFNLIDSRGRIVRSDIFKHKLIVERESLSPGVYMIELKSQKSKIQQKLMIYE